MISPEVPRILSTAREAVQLEQEWSMMNSVPAGGRAPVGTEGPSEYLELLGIANGGIFGRVVIFDAKTVTNMQFYADETEGAPVRLGCDNWFCLGKVNDDPVFVNRADGSAWGFPDRGVIWWQSDVFECWAEGVGDFILNFALGRGYRRVTGASEGDQWWRLLRHIGRAE
ncbi:hypothetical protein OHT68_00435 [Streptomyces canus]|uniref:hypothetical protein n=1 Tax=Streptomyces canus TaxID=58343 RepID=UPI002E29879D|nr:hypothetical protein [Streptomyces canus]